jgi:hypothetical protein
MRLEVCPSLLLLVIAVTLAGCSSKPTVTNSNSTAAATPAMKVGTVAEFDILNAWKPKTVIVQVYGGDKFTLTAKPGTEFIALELMMKTDDAAHSVPEAMWGGTVLIDSKGNRSQAVFNYAAPLVKYQPGGDTVEYVGRKSTKPGRDEELGRNLKDTGGKLVVVFGAPTNDPQLKLEIAKTTLLDIPLGGK